MNRINRAVAAFFANVYAINAIAQAIECDEAPVALFVAIREAQTQAERVALAEALMCRHHALSDAGYRVGEPNCDESIQQIADALGWTP